jgi:hypothetical protein
LIKYAERLDALKTHASACSDTWPLEITHRTRLRVAARGIITATAAVLASVTSSKRSRLRQLYDPRSPDLLAAKFADLIETAACNAW